MSGIKLYSDAFWISPYSLSAFVALREKGLEFEVVTVSLAQKENRGGDHLRRSLTGRVPTLEHDGFSLAESSAIVEYIEDAFPHPRHPRLLPEDPRDRARARMIMAWVRSDLNALREERPSATMFYERATIPLTPAGEEDMGRLLSFADAIVSPDRTTLFSSWCIADTDLGFMLNRLALNGHPLSPKVRAFAEANWKRPSVQAFADRKRPPFAQG